jgi:hypothetical protein
MNPHVCALVLAMVAAISAPQAEEKIPPYKFAKGDAAKYEVAGDLSISLKGSHKDLILGGIEEPIRMSYRAQFENVVLEVAEDGTANLERRVRTLTAEGMVSGNPFRFVWDRAKDQGKPAGPGEGPDTVPGLFRTWCTDPLRFSVSSAGKYSCRVENYDQLANKAGVMYWVVGLDGKPWLTEEKIAAPLLHDKVVIEFKNTAVKNFMVGGRKITQIDAKPSLKGTIAAPPGIPRPADGPVEFTVAGEGNKVEWDATKRRLHSVKLDLTIKLSGKGTVADGGKGDLRGEVRFTESQKFLD